MSGNYRVNQQTFNGRILWSQATSEGGLLPFALSPSNSNTFHGETSTWQVSGDYLQQTIACHYRSESVC
ncbi:MtrB/PioB family outer membrane beta-barrel protein [Vibrio sp. M60_M31a]